MTLKFESFSPELVSYIMKKFDTFNFEKEDRRAKQYFITKPFENAINLIILNNEEIVGFTSYVVEGDIVYLAWTYLFPEFRNKGFGKEILLFREKKAKDLGCNIVYCKVKEDNPKSQDFFYNLGFKEIKRELDEIIYQKYI